jgi:hypothetical protein
VAGRFTLFSDPVHGFISVPRNLLFDLIGTPEVQRLRRIRQLGVGYLVFPGAEHSRFGHALGAMALMHDTLASLAEKGTPIAPDEHTAACAAALLHDIGHGPFSHTLEHELIRGFRHEAMSRVLLEHLDARFGGRLRDAIAIFDGTYPRPFFHALVSSQLDMDRLDYLRRDSHYTGVVEGRVGVERIIKTLRVVEHDGVERMAIEAKGFHAVENFLFARRLMYWQVYLHKAVLAGDHVLRAILRRVRHLVAGGEPDAVSGGAPDFMFFLRNDVQAGSLSEPDVRDRYCALDDADMLFSIKHWMSSTDPVLSDLATRFIHRRLPAVTYFPAPVEPAVLDTWRGAVARWLVDRGMSDEGRAAGDAAYYVTAGTARHSAYDTSDTGIAILARDGSLADMGSAAESAPIAALGDGEEKHFVCHPKEVRPADLPAA